VVGGDRARTRLSSGPIEPDDTEYPGREADGAVAISDLAHVRAILLTSARQRRPMSYADVLNALGHPFTRPRMRALCRTLDAIDEAAAAAGEPDLAVLVVRQSDGLPGQGWWVGTAARDGYAGSWTGPGALAFVRARQREVFAYWVSREAEP
jgi:hypothetical protein